MRACMRACVGMCHLSQIAMLLPMFVVEISLTRSRISCQSFITDVPRLFAQLGKRTKDFIAALTDADYLLDSRVLTSIGYFL